MLRMQAGVIFDVRVTLQNDRMEVEDIKVTLADILSIKCERLWWGNYLGFAKPLIVMPENMAANSLRITNTSRCYLAQFPSKNILILRLYSVYLLIFIDRLI